MDEKTLKSDYDLVSQRDDQDDDYLMICEKSENDDKTIGTENSQDVTYEIHDGDEIYQLVGQTKLNTSRPPTTLISSANKTDNCQYYVLNDIKPSSAKRPCLILPKPSNYPNDNELLQQNHQPKKRDEIRRATHNEVERRRRDKINEWIFKLKELFPENPLEVDKSNPMAAAAAACKNSQNYSKSGILIRACDYVKEMQAELSRLKKCLSNSENLQRENTMLISENELLKSEIEQLKNSCSTEQKKNICETVRITDSSKYKST